MIEGLGQRLKVLRIQNNLSRKQVAELIHVSVSLIGLYETDERQPSLSILLKLASCYKVSTDYLLGYSPSAPSSISTAGLNMQQIQAITYLIDCLKSGNRGIDMS